MKKKKWVMIVAILLALFMIIPVVIGACQSYAVSSSDVAELEDKADDLADRRDQLEDQIDNLKKQSDSALETKQAIDEQIDVTQQQIDNANALIAALDEQIAQKEAELSQAEQAEREQLALFKERIRAMEEAGTTSYIAILMKADNFSNLLSRAEIIQELMEYDQGVMDQLKEQHQKVEDAKGALEGDRAQQLAVQDALEKTKADLESQCQQAQELMDELQQNYSQLEDAYAKVEQEEDRVQQQIKDMLAELARQNASSGVYVGGEYTWPAPGYYNITCPFGMRLHPILKVYKMHTGIDIGAPKGAKIVAANAGTIIKSTYSTAYGNYVVISHGGGQATLYGHMSQRLVSEGDYVGKGDTIGLVGSTGYSTGNHLHFEIIIDGTQVNPENYFSKQ